MNRPSHWILAFFAVMGPALWVWGLTETSGLDHGARRPGTVAPVAAEASVDRSKRLAQQEVHLIGRIVSRSGEAIDGAQVRVLGTRSAAVTTDGRFEVPVLSAESSLRVEVSAAGYQPQVARCALGDAHAFAVALAPRAPWTQPEELGPAPSKPLRAGEGFVLDGDGKPIAGAHVQVQETGASAVTDGIGRYRVALPAAEATLLVWDDAGRSHALDITNAHPSGIEPLPEITLREGVQIAGDVRLAGGGAAAGVSVIARLGDVVRRTAVADDGHFTLSGLIAGDWELEVVPSAGHLGVTRLLSVEGSGGIGELVLPESPLRRVRVLDAAEHAVADVWVTAADPEGRVGVGRTDAEGWANLSGLGAGALQVREVRRADDSYRALDVAGWNDPTVHVR